MAVYTGDPPTSLWLTAILLHLSASSNFAHPTYSSPLCSYNDARLHRCNLDSRVFASVWASGAAAGGTQTGTPLLRCNRGPGTFREARPSYLARFRCYVVQCGTVSLQHAASPIVSCLVDASMAGERWPKNGFSLCFLFGPLPVCLSLSDRPSDIIFLLSI